MTQIVHNGKSEERELGVFENRMCPRIEITLIYNNNNVTHVIIFAQFHGQANLRDIITVKIEIDLTRSTEYHILPPICIVY
jgi:hypothetical protein